MRKWLALFVVIALGAAAACDLNPQPLPPGATTDTRSDAGTVPGTGAKDAGSTTGPADGAGDASAAFDGGDSADSGGSLDAAPGRDAGDAGDAGDSGDAGDASEDAVGE